MMRCGESKAVFITNNFSNKLFVNTWRKQSMNGYGSVLNNEKKPKGSFKIPYDEIDTKKISNDCVL